MTARIFTHNRGAANSALSAAACTDAHCILRQDDQKMAREQNSWLQAYLVQMQALVQALELVQVQA